jgi:hypothetical protein
MWKQTFVGQNLNIEKIKKKFVFVKVLKYSDVHFGKFSGQIKGRKGVSYQVKIQLRA